MKEEKERGKEYYQVNLDTGRIFWIAFILGLIIIGIFIFGFLIGGPEGKKDFLDLAKSGVFKKEKAAAATKNKDELESLGLLDDNLETETRYIDVTSLEKAASLEKTASLGETAKEGEKVTKIQPERVETVERKTAYRAPVTGEKTSVKKATPKISQIKPRRASIYGHYYIQAASFAKKENAERFASVLEKNLYKVTIEKAVVKESTFYRVHVGPFEKKSVAVNTMTAMKRRFDLNDPFVLKKNS